MAAGIPDAPAPTTTTSYCTESYTEERAETPFLTVVAVTKEGIIHPASPAVVILRKSRRVFFIGQEHFNCNNMQI